MYVCVNHYCKAVSENQVKNSAQFGHGMGMRVSPGNKDQR